MPDRQLDALLAAFVAGTTVVEASLSYLRLDFQQIFEVLPDAFSIRPAVSRSEGIKLFERALRDCRIAGRVDAETLAARASAIRTADLAVAPRPFTLWTKFRATGMVFVPGFRLDWRGVRLRTAAHLPAWLARGEYFLNGVGRMHPDRPHLSGHVVLTCADRDEDRAVDRMLDALQLMLGLLNAYESWGRHTWHGARKWSEAGLWNGPLQLVFDGRRFTGEDRVWFNPDYDEEAWKLHPPPMRRVLEIVPRARRALTALEGHPFEDVLLRAVRLIQDGMASRDGSHRLLRYWSALEQLYVEADAKGRSNEKVLERAVFPEREPDLVRWKLEHIARLRNEHVHAGGSGDDLFQMGQFLRELVVRHLNHWIFTGRDLTDHQALLDLVKLPDGRDALVRMRGLIDRRLSYLPDGGPEPTSDR